MLGDLVASADPDPVVAQDVIDETGKRGGARRLAGETAMQSNGHHLRRLLALAVERVEIVAQRDEGGGCRKADGTPGLPSAPEMPCAPRLSRLVPKAAISY
jgi:hypothetical protein